MLKFDAKAIWTPIVAVPYMSGSAEFDRCVTVYLSAIFSSEVIPGQVHKMIHSYVSLALRITNIEDGL